MALHLKHELFFRMHSFVVGRVIREKYFPLEQNRLWEVYVFAAQELITYY